MSADDRGVGGVVVACPVCRRAPSDHTLGLVPGEVWVGGVGHVPCEGADEALRLACVGEREIAIRSDFDAPPLSGPGWLAGIHALALVAGHPDCTAWPGASGYDGAALAGAIAGETEGYTKDARVISYLEAASELLGLAYGVARSRPSAATIDAVASALEATGLAVRQARAGGES